MNTTNIVAGLIFVIVLLSGLAYTMYKSHVMVRGNGRPKQNGKSKQK